MLLSKLQYGIGIRRRIVFIFFVFSVIVIYTSFLFTRLWIASLEEKTRIRFLKQGYSSAMSLLNSKISVLRSVVKIYSLSRDIRSLIERSSPQEAEAFFEALMARLNFEGAVLFDKDQKVVYENIYFGPENVTGELYKHFSDNSSVEGFWRSPNNNLWLFVSFPVISQEVERQGTLIFALLINDSFAEELQSQLELKVNIFHNMDFFTGDYLGSYSEAGSLKRSWAELQYTQQPYTIFKNFENERGIFILDALIRDFRGDPVAILQLRDDVRFPFYSERNLYYLLWLAFVLLGLAFFLMLKFLTSNVTLPLVKLKKAIQDITSSGDLSKRLVMESEDEVGGLIFEFNRMLDTLEKMNKKIKHSSEELSILYSDLLEQKRFTSEILSLAPSMVLMFLPDGRIKYVNEAIEQVTGFKTEESIGRIWFDQFVPFSERNEAKEIFDMILKGGIEKYRQKESTILTKDGKERLILWNYSVLKNATGEITAIIAVGQDVTELKKIESELLKKMNDLERFYRVSMDREKNILSLKKQIGELRMLLNKQEQE